MKKKKRKKIKVRKEWTRSPVEKVHSTKKGKKGYKRNKTVDEEDITG